MTNPNYDDRRTKQLATADRIDVDFERDLGRPTDIDLCAMHLALHPGYHPLSSLRERDEMRRDATYEQIMRMEAK